MQGDAEGRGREEKGGMEGDREKAEKVRRGWREKGGMEGDGTREGKR